MAKVALGRRMTETGNQFPDSIKPQTTSVAQFSPLSQLTLPVERGGNGYLNRFFVRNLKFRSLLAHHGSVSILIGLHPIFHHHDGSQSFEPQHPAAVRDTGYREEQAPSAGDRGEHHGGLPEGQDRPHEPGIHPDEWRLCGAGAVHDPRQSPQRNGKRQSKG